MNSVVNSSQSPPPSSPLWTPEIKRIEQSSLSQFIKYIKDKHALFLRDYNALHQWSVDEPSLFWEAVAIFCGLKMSTPADVIYTKAEHMRDAKWFTGCRLNFAENLLQTTTSAAREQTAIIFQGEDNTRLCLTYQQLYEQVSKVASALRKLGVQPGDRVAGFVPNRPEAVVAMLATASIGAVWSSCSPDFGFNGVLDRFAQIKPKVLFSADGYYFKGKSISSLPIVKQLEHSLDSLIAIIFIPYLIARPEITSFDHAYLYPDLLATRTTESLEFTQLPFDHPLYIMFSSGTTGKPKCIVHGSGGTLIQHLKELLLHTDLKAAERIFYYTTCGWMMWNWMVSGLAVGATLVLYDGSPFYPNENALADIIEKEKVNIFGTSAKYIAALEKANIKPRKTHDLSSLRCILSTGSPLSPELFDYVYRDIKQDIQLSSISGGTDIISCFALGNPILPVYRGELQCKGLGMDVAIYDDNANSIIQQKGELVCRAAFPSMPLYFWNDEQGKKYHDAYFSRFYNVWAQSDYAEITEHNGLSIYGRSDAVLNPGGVRIGTAEIYRPVEKLAQILESIAVGQMWKDDVRVVLFVKLREGITLDASLQREIRQVIKANATPRHVPAIILPVKDIPRTLSGKIVELAVRHIIHHEEVKNRDALANPEALEYFKQFEALEFDG